MASLKPASERACYVQCNFCNTILGVSVPCNSMYAIVTVRCGHCANLLSVNMGALFHSLPLQDVQQFRVEYPTKENGSSSSKTDKFGPFDPPSDRYNQPPSTPPIRPPEKRQRAPSAYNRFIKDEIQRIKASNPEISHREAFSSAAKNWAHFPNIHFGVKMDGIKGSKVIGPPIN